MKRARDICIRALCAIFVGVVLGCSGSGDSGGGSDIENDGGNGGNQQNGWQQPAYMNVTEEFGGQRFVEEKTNWLYDNQGYAKFTAHCDDAERYIADKVVELQKLWEEKNTGSALSSQINTALNNFNNGTSIDEKIINNYTAMAPVLVTMENNLLSDAPVNYHRYKSSYYKLAANAYNKSLGHCENSPDNRVLTNKEMKNMPENFFVDVLNFANLTYNELTVKKAQEIMNDSLMEVANKTNTDTAVLKKVVELAMYNESLYGLTDLAKLDTVVSRGAPLRKLTVLEDIIGQEWNNTKTQSIDDGRTM